MLAYFNKITILKKDECPANALRACVIVLASNYLGLLRFLVVWLSSYAIISF